MAKHPIQMTADMIETGALAAALYRARQDRLVHPEGSFDNASRWYPSDAEDSDGYTYGKRSPSRAFPNGYNSAARSKKHVIDLSWSDPEFFARKAAEAVAILGGRLTAHERELGAGRVLRDARATHDAEVARKLAEAKKAAAEKAAADKATADAAAQAEAEAEAKAAVERDEDGPFLADMAA